jgi:hypothetical protein
MDEAGHHAGEGIIAADTFGADLFSPTRPGNGCDPFLCPGIIELPSAFGAVPDQKFLVFMQRSQRIGLFDAGLCGETDCDRIAAIF